MILVIDDNKDLCNIICKILGIFGYDAIGVNSGEEGIDKAKAISPEIILCDIGMEGINGHDVARYIKGQEDLKETYLIAISGYSSENDKNISKEAGFDVHIGKPIDFDKLKGILEAKCNR